jgi:hypothetical protein
MAAIVGTTQRRANVGDHIPALVIRGLHYGRFFRLYRDFSESSKAW